MRDYSQPPLYHYRVITLFDIRNLRLALPGSYTIIATSSATELVVLSDVFLKLKG